MARRSRGASSAGASRGTRPDGSIYVTASRIMDMTRDKPENPIALPTAPRRLDPDGE